MKEGIIYLVNVLIDYVCISSSTVFILSSQHNPLANSPSRPPLLKRVTVWVNNEFERNFTASLVSFSFHGDNRSSNVDHLCVNFV